MTEKTWASLGFVEGKTIHEAVTALGFGTILTTKRVENTEFTTEVETAKGVLQLIACPDKVGCQWLVFRLIDRTKSGVPAYEPSNKPSRKARGSGKRTVTL